MITDMKCPHCGAELTLSPDKKTAFCEYCESTVLIESGSASGAADEHTSEAVFPEARPVSPRRKNTFWWVMGWIFIFPIPLTILTARNKKISPAVKALIIIGVWCVYLLIVLLNEYAA